MNETTSPPAATAGRPGPVRRYPWRTFWCLTLAGTLTGPLVIPYIRGLAAIAPYPPHGLPESTTLLVLGLLARGLVMLGVATGVGLLVARKIGLGAPYLEHRLDGGPEPAEPLASIVRPAIFWASATAAIAFAVDAVFHYGLGVDFPAPEIHARIDVAWWRSGLASFWAPFSEELFDRLFLLSLIAWLGMKVFRVRGAGRGRTIALWVANAATALFFGWTHIGNEEMFAEVVPALVVVRTLLIIVPIGLAFGWLYWRRGLEAAILSHFVIDIFVHVVRPIVEGWLR